MSIQNEVLTAIASRRSCRAYKPEQITAEELNAVTAAGTWAPTAMGRQSPVMVAVQDKETLTKLSRLNAAVMGTQNDPFYGARLIQQEPRPMAEAASNRLPSTRLASCTPLGLVLSQRTSTAVGAKETFEMPEGKALLTKWGLDAEKYAGVGYCILGYPAAGGTHAPAPRKADYVLHV